MAEVQKLSMQHALQSDTDERQATAALPPDLLADFIEGESELPAVNAVLGGVLANAALKAVSFDGVPINNILLFSLHDGMGEVEIMA